MFKWSIYHLIIQKDKGIAILSAMTIIFGVLIKVDELSDMRRCKIFGTKLQVELICIANMHAFGDQYLYSINK